MSETSVKANVAVGSSVEPWDGANAHNIKALITGQSDITYSSNQFDSLPGSLLLVACLCVAAAFFFIGVGVGRRQTKHYELIVTRIRQIQTLERIWQMKAERKD